MDDNKLGDLTIGLSSYPAEEIPFNKESTFKSVPFQLVKRATGEDNLQLVGQELNIPPFKVTKIHFIGCSVNGDIYDDLIVKYNQRVIGKERMFLSEVFSEKPAFNDKLFLDFNYSHSRQGINNNLRPKLWYNYIRLNKAEVVNKIEFEDNPFIHIFAITFEHS